MRCTWTICLAVVAVLTVSRPAYAYPWMNRHGYSGCATCHADPSGAGLLTAYGRAQSELLLSTRFQVDRTNEASEPSRFSQALFGLVDLPDSALLGAFVRAGQIWNAVDGKLVDQRRLLMRADVAAQISAGPFRANASIGIASPDGAALTQQAALTASSDSVTLLSREHWLGWDLADQAVLLRAGRINLPFGLRGLEHTLWTRSETRTDINQAQQHGIAAAYNDERVRAELMVVLGNYQVSPDRYRERGASGYAELHVSPRFDIGVSGQLLRSETDIALRARLVRQSYGVFLRAVLSESLALLAEGDLLIHDVPRDPPRAGGVGFVQLDYEPLQGLHSIVTSELLHAAATDAQTRWGLWGSVAWFFAPHFDMRADVIRRTGSDVASMTYLLQLHGYL